MLPVFRFWENKEKTMQTRAARALFVLLAIDAGGKHAHVRQVAVDFVVIQAVAHHEASGIWKQE